MTLVIRDQLVCPPTWFASFRDLTLYCHILLKLDIVIESDDPDIYYRWIKPKGGMDFIADFVRPGTRTARDSISSTTRRAPSSRTASRRKTCIGSSRRSARWRHEAIPVSANRRP